MPVNVLSIVIIIWSGQLSTNDSCDMDIPFECLYILLIDFFNRL